MSQQIRMSEDDRKRLGSIVRERGDKKAAGALEISPATLARAIAGFGVQRTTVTHLRSKLAELTQAPAPMP